MPPFLLLLLLGGAYTVINKSKSSNTTIKSPDLYISKDCKKFTFVDKTGNKWWENIGYNIAKKIKNISGEIDSLDMAFRTLNDWQRENLKEENKCFIYPYQKDVPNGFPMLAYDDLLPEDIGIFNQEQLAYKRIYWIKNNPEMWKLIWNIRNKIDTNLFEGIETVEINSKNIGKNNPIITGKNFDYDILWDNFLESILTAVLKIENKKPKTLINFDYDIEYRTTIYAMRILFPNLTDDEFKKWANMGGNNISQTQLFKNILISIDKLIDDELVI